MSLTRLSALESAPGLRTVQGLALLDELARKARPGERPEEILFDLGLVTDRDFCLELSLRTGKSYVGLRGFSPDERLFLYLPLQLAVTERVCPLVIVGDSLKVASAYLDPDLSTVERRFPHLEIELVLSPRSEILAALQKVQRAL